MAILEKTSRGLYCEQADVYIDPDRKVTRALITHAHSDHSRPGHKYYLCTPQTGLLLHHHYGEKINLQTSPYGEAVHINGVKFSFHPAGHVFGSAQIRVEYQGEVWVVSGDYKLDDDGVSVPFEPVKCNVFITESTFGLPQFHWKPQENIFSDIHNWWKKNQQEERLSILMAYPLGKTQHLLRHLDGRIGPVFSDQPAEKINHIIRREGIQLLASPFLTHQVKAEKLRGALVIASPAIRKSPWLYQQPSYALAMVSGWIAMKKGPVQASLFGDSGFPLSDHADFEGLHKAVAATGATRVLVTHGYAEYFAKSLREKGLDADIL
jgi:putative mRNA 3-end processing factor